MTPGAPTPEGYPAGWEADVVLADGGVLELRPIRPDDAGGLRDLAARLSEQTLYQRFMTVRRDFSDEELARFAGVDYRDRMAFVGLRGGRIVAVGRYERVSGAPRAEVAFVVEDPLQGRGIGMLLLEHLAAYARTQGITRFDAITLGDNRRMLDVFETAGFAVERRLVGPTWEISFPLDPMPVATIEAREHLAEARSVRRLLAPGSVAVVGASRDPGSIGHAVVANLVAGGFRGPVYPVNPHADEIHGLACYPSVDALPATPDLAVVAVPAAAVLDVAEACGRAGVHGLVVLSAGFAETGPAGRQAEAKLLDVVRGWGMRMVGPNCMGILNTHPDVRLNATFAPVSPVPGRVGFLSQSGALGIALLDDATRLGIGISTFVSVGNKADISGNDLLQYWEDDPDTGVALLYLESFGNPRKFRRLAPRVAARIPVVAVKSGRTGAGQRAAASHTAALASPDAAVDALFRQAGVVRVDTIEDMFGAARVLATQPLPAGRRVGIVGNSGGPGILAADACGGVGLEVPPLADATRTRLDAIVRPGASTQNPVDLLAAAGPGEYRAALAAVLEDPGIDAVVAIYTNPLVSDPHEIAAAVADAAASSPKPTVACFLATTDVGPLLAPTGGTGAAGERRVPVFPYPEAPVRALAHAAGLAEWRARPTGRALEVPDAELRAVREILDGALARMPSGGWLDAPTVDALARAARIPVVPARVVRGLGATLEAARDVGLPVALKAVGPRIVHKTDVGGVHLDLGTLDEVAAAHDDLVHRLGADLDAVQVQPMVRGGVEVIVGLVQDATFGPLVLFGLGGTATEVLADRSFALTPLTDVDAAELVRSLRATPLLLGHRGAPPADLAALEDLLRRIGWLGDAFPEITELDANPVLAAPDGAHVVDMRVRVAPAAPREPPVRRM